MAETIQTGDAQESQIFKGKPKSMVSAAALLIAVR